jgi:hypothetical protein
LIINLTYIRLYSKMVAFMIAVVDLARAKFCKGQKVEFTALTAPMRYISKSESFDRRGQGEKLYCIIAGSAVLVDWET